MKTLFKALFILLVVVFVGGAVKEADALSYAPCSFYRDLYVGSRGEDVRCLQQYLQTSGYGTVFSSYGSPDGVFGPMTQQYLIQWQVSNGLPATGYFDANSRARLGGNGIVLGASTYVPEYTTTYTYPTACALYDVNTGRPTNNCGGNGGYGTYDDTRAWNKIEEALIMIEDAEDEIDDSNKSTSKADNLLDDAKEDIYDAVHAYFVDRDFDEAFDKGEDALDNAEEAYDEVDGDSGSKADAKNAIEDAQDAIDDARDDIEDADDDGDDVDDAWDILEDAEDMLDDAEDEYDDKDYDKAEELADDARELANDAVDAIN